MALRVAETAKFWGVTPSSLMGLQGSLDGFVLDQRLALRLQAEEDVSGEE